VRLFHSHTAATSNGNIDKSIYDQEKRRLSAAISGGRRRVDHAAATPSVTP